ncbi:MAG: hypothetical protein AB7G08_13260 [Hyphomicrobiaceae bacterium]
MRLSKQQWAEARAHYEEHGLGPDAIAVRFGLHHRTVRRRIREDGWRRAGEPPKEAQDAASFEALTVAARRALVQRLYKAIDTKLKLMERRMLKQMVNLGKGSDLPSADHERDARALGTIIKTIDQVKEMQADLDRVAGGQTATPADAELFAEAERFRREIAERLARFVPPAG